MSYFDELLRSPLPSAAGNFYEGEDDFDKEMKKMDQGGSGSNDNKPDLNMKDEDFDDDLDDFGGDAEDDDFYDDPDEMDADLDELERELGVSGGLEDAEDDDSDESDEEDEYAYDEDDECGYGDECGDECGYENVPTSVDDPTPAEPLTGAADEEADRMMALIATPTVLDATLKDEDGDFVESGELDTMVSEGFITESDADEIRGDHYSNELYMESRFAPEGRKYKMTKRAKLKQLYEISLQIEARQHHDPYYKKLQKAYKIERTIKAGWRKRYHALALRRAKKYLKALMRSKSPILKKAARKFGVK